MSSEADMHAFLEKLYSLRRDKKGDYERPHKPALLLTVIDMIAAGEITENRILFSQELRSRFKVVFELVRRGNDQPRAQYPYHFLNSDGFWTTSYLDTSKPVYDNGQATCSPTVGHMRQCFARLSPEVFALLMNPITRSEIRDSLIARYFPWQSDGLVPDTAGAAHPGSEVREDQDDTWGEEEKPARDAAFARTVKEVYDYRCAACGQRLRLKSIHFVDAAHLVPFAESHNDHPTNGMALCKNHHWALDSRLIAPDPGLRWCVSPCLDRRIADHAPLVQLHGQTVLCPSEKKFVPATEGLDYRMEHLLQ